MAREPVLLLLSYEFYRSRLDLDPDERGRIPIIENSTRHTITALVEAPITHTLTLYAQGFLSADPARGLELYEARGGRAGLRFEAGLRLRVEGYYGYNSESFSGTSGEVHEASLRLAYVF